MAEFQFTKDVNASKLLEEIKDSAIAGKFHELRTNGDLVIVVTNTDLIVSEQTTLNNLIAAHAKNNDSATARDRVKRSILFGLDILSDLAAFFLKRNLSNVELQTVSTRFATFQQLIYGGYFEAAKASLSQVVVDPLVPQQLIDQLNVKMQRFIDLVKNG